MRLFISLRVDHAARYRLLLLPFFFVISSSTAAIHTPVQHTLLVSAAAGALLWLGLTSRIGLWSGLSDGRCQGSLLAGGLLGMALVCERAACDNEGISVTKCLLPLLSLTIPRVYSILFSIYSPNIRPLNYAPASHGTVTSYGGLIVLTLLALVVLATYVLSTTAVLGLSSIVFAAAGLALCSRVLDDSCDDHSNDAHHQMQPHINDGEQRLSGTEERAQHTRLAAIRCMVFVLAMACFFAAFCLEPFPDNTVFQSRFSQDHAGNWTLASRRDANMRVVTSIALHLIIQSLIFIELSCKGAYFTCLLIVLSQMLAKVYITFTVANVWFTTVYGLLTLVVLQDTLDAQQASRLRRNLSYVAILSVCLWSLLQVHGKTNIRPFSASHPHDSSRSSEAHFNPIPIDLGRGHPADQLISDAETNFQKLLKRQSYSLVGAVSEYRRRYGIAPPPHFDKWYEFAVRNGVVLIDEFDIINELLTPFWAIDPVTIRSRVKDALGHEDNALIAIAIRNGEVKRAEHGDDWQRKATIDMMRNFVRYLPNMDLGFNIHDEPRVIVPNSLLHAMVSKAQQHVLPKVAKMSYPQNKFSTRPKDLNDGSRFEETGSTKFNRFAHQQTWTHSRLSCPADTQAQNFEEHAPDNVTAYATGTLGHIYNVTAFSDICSTPSLSSSFGFFERPNTFNIIQELTPIFSQSKISSFQDILYPSPWYWASKVAYDESHDTTWKNKTNILYWRGSTTGGFSRNGGWRRQHRQRIVQRLNALDEVQVLVPLDPSPADEGGAVAHAMHGMDRKWFKHLIDVKFSHVGQCDPGDCDAQREFFHVTEHEDGQNAWFHRHLLDMDGNAFSGRFYSFLQSRSLTYKMAIFREWHAEWLKPWIHYIPLSLKGDEHLDLVRWFSGHNKNIQKHPEQLPGTVENKPSVGERKAEEIARRSTDWHNKVLRKIDMEVWFFRLLLEYGRIVDDNRENIGYSGP